MLVLLLTVGLCLSFVGCSKPTQTTFAPSGESKGTIKLGFDAEYPPFGYLDTKTNQYAGFDIEFAKAVCEKLSYTLVLVPIDWAAKDMALESGDIDMIWNGFTINGREDQYEWTCAYVDNSIVVMTLKDSGINSLADLAGKTVTVQADSSGESALKGEDCASLVASFKDGKYLTCKDYTTASQELKAGAVDAVVIDIGVANYFTSDETKILTEAVASEQYGIGFFKGNTELRDLIEDTVLDLAETTDIVRELGEKYGIYDSIIIGK